MLIFIKDVGGGFVPCYIMIHSRYVFVKCYCEKSFFIFAECAINLDCQNNNLTCSKVKCAIISEKQGDIETETEYNPQVIYESIGEQIKIDNSRYKI